MIDTPTAPALTLVPTVPMSGLVPSLGSTRRLRALAREGWPARAIASATKLSPRTVMRIRAGQRHWVQAAVAAAIADVYDVVSSLDPARMLPPTRAARDAVRFTRALAARRGWSYTPAAWEGLNIDDPTADPAAENRRARPTRSGTADELLELVATRADMSRRLEAWRRLPVDEKRRAVLTPQLQHLTADEVGELLGITGRTVQRYRGPEFTRTFPHAVAS